MLGHRQRLYERFDTVGLSGFSAHEKLELLLTFAIPRKDCKPLAKSLLKRFGSMARVLHADAKDLQAVDGMGAASARLIKVLSGLFAEYFREEAHQKPKITCAEDVAEYLVMSDEDQGNEKFRVLFLNSKNQILALETVSLGTIDHAPVYVRNIAQKCLQYQAKSVILAHNHPSGDPKPSMEDLELTERIVEALSLFEIRVLDHVIVAQKSYYSFADHDILANH